MKKYLPTIAIFLLVVAIGVFVYLKYVESSAISTSQNTNIEDNNGAFEYEDVAYVDNSEIGRFPGVAKHNSGSSEFSTYTQNQSGRAKIREKYVLYMVEEIVNLAEGRVLLFASGEKTEHIFKCSNERTAAFTLVNQNFISSGFDFMSTVTPGDRVYSKCLNADCFELGPDCIILKGTLN